MFPNNYWLFQSHLLERELYAQLVYFFFAKCILADRYIYRKKLRVVLKKLFQFYVCIVDLSRFKFLFETFNFHFSHWLIPFKKCSQTFHQFCYPFQLLRVLKTLKRFWGYFLFHRGVFRKRKTTLDMDLDYSFLRAIF